MYLDRLDGQISAEVFDEKSKKFSTRSRKRGANSRSRSRRGSAHLAAGLRSTAEAHVALWRVVGSLATPLIEAEHSPRHCSAAQFVVE
jgi:hypothetical protein